MNTTTQQPDSALQNIIQRITENLLIDQIYLHPYTIQGKQISQLYVLLRNSAGQGITAARALCNLAIAEKPAYRCYVSLPEDMNRKIKQGNMRATLICHPDKLVFEHPDVDTRIQHPKVDYGVWHTQAESYFEKELSRIRAFEEGYAFYLKKANYSQAAFMLHQVIELGCRVAENLVMGKEKISHSLCKHQEYIIPFCPELGMLFGKQHELLALRKLDESYSSARYDHDFSISKEELAIVSNKVKELLAYVIGYNRNLLDEIQQRQQYEGEQVQRTSEDASREKIGIVDPATNIEKDDIPLSNADELVPGHREHILSVICQYFSPTHVFCFAQHSWNEHLDNFIPMSNIQTKHNRYYLAILTQEQPEQPLYRQNQVNEVLGEQLEIVALYFVSDTFTRKLEEGHEFFHFVATSTEKWFGEELKQGIIPKPLTVDKRRSVWQYHFSNAEGLVEMSRDHIGVGHDECTAVVMAQAMEQLFLGFLYAFWGYRPDTNIHLMYLIRLSESIHPIARKSFCLDIPEELAMIKRLSHALNEFRYNSNFEADDYGLYIIYDRLKPFMHGLEDFVNQRIETLK